MPNLTATIGITDNLTTPLRNMANAISSVTANLGDIASASGKLDPKKFSAMQSAAQQLDHAVSELEQETNKATTAQEKHNKSMQEGESTSGKLSSGFKSLAGAVAGVVAGYASWQTLSAAVDLSDTLSQTTSRLNMINDGMQTTEELQKKIYDAAQNSRGSYQDMADMVSKLGTNAKDAFSSNDEMVAFAEQLNKQFVLAGASADEMAAASLQLTQGLASGTLRGDELNSVMEQAPTVIQTIADSLGVSTGEIRNMAAEGQITADVVKNALLGATDETNAKFAQMSMTFDQVWTNFKNQALMAFQPVLESINGIANNPALMEAVNKVSGVIGGMGPAIASVVDSVANIVPAGLNAMIDSFQWIVDNANMVAAGLAGIAVAITAVNVANQAKEAGGFAQMFSGLGESLSSITALINPMNLLIAAIAGIAAASIYLVATGTSLAEVTQFFTNFQDTVSNAVQNITSGIQKMAEGFAESFPTFASQLGAMIPTIIEGILGSAMSLVDAGAQIAVSLLNGLMTALPSMITGGISMVTNIISGIMSMIPRLAEQALIIIENFATALAQNLPNMIEKGGEAILAFINGINAQRETLLQSGISAIVGFVQTIAEHIPTLIQRGAELVGSLVQGIVAMLPQLAASAVALIANLGIYIIQNLPQIIQAGIQIVIALASGLIQAIPAILSGLGTIFVSFFSALAEYGPQILTAAGEVATNLWNGFVNGLSAGWEGLTSFLSDTFNNVISFVKGIFGIASPSTVFSEIGGFLMEGLGNGIQAMWDGISGAIGSIGGAIKDLLTPDVDYAQMIENTRNQINQLQADVSAGYDTIKNVTLQQGQEMASGTIAIYAEMTGQILGQIGSLAGQITGLLAGISGSFVAIFDSIRAQTVGYLIALSGDAIGQINAMIAGISATLAGLTGIFAGAFMAVTASVIAQLTVMQGSCIAVLTGLTAAAVASLSGLSAGAIGAINGMTGGFIGAITAMSASATAIVTAMAGVIGGIIAGLSGIVIGQAVLLQTSYIGIWQSIYQNSVAVMTSMVGALTALMQTLVATLINIGNQLPAQFRQIGQSMMTELAGGISAQAQLVQDVTSALVERIKSIFITGLGIHSPSKFMDWIGQMMAAGLINGLSNSQINSFVEGIIGDMRGSFKNGKFVPDELVEYLGDDTTKVIDYLVRIGDQTVADDVNGALGGTPAIIQEALKYVGYKGQGGLNGSSMFGLRYGNPGAWCVSFVRYCAENVGVPFPATNYVPDVTAWAQANGKWTMTPQPGYAAIFSNRHIELVAGVNGGTVDYIGGNTGNGEVKHRPRSDATGFVALDGGHSVLTLKDAIQQAWYKKIGMNFGGSFTGAFDPTSSGLSTPDWFLQWAPPPEVARWAPNVLQVLNMLGEPASLLKGVLWAINGESGGDPNSTYLGDVNVIYGGSKGLLQTITPNFERWKNPSLPNDIYDPTQNIWTCLREMQDTYGGIANLINRKIARGKWSGYASGTTGASKGWHWVGENGPELLQFAGGERVYPHMESMAIANGLVLNDPSTNSVNPFDPTTYDVNFNESVNTDSYVPVTSGGTTNHYTTQAPINFRMEPTINTREEFDLSVSEMESKMTQALKNVTANNGARLRR